VVLKRVQFLAKDKCKSTFHTIAPFKPKTHKPLKISKIILYFTVSKYGILLFKIKQACYFVEKF